MVACFIDIWWRGLGEGYGYWEGSHFFGNTRLFSYHCWVDNVIVACNSYSSTFRFLMLGLSFKLRVLVVCHCIREKGDVIRIISARKATKQENKYYWEERS